MVKVCVFDMGGVVDMFDGDDMEKKLLRYFGITDCDSFLALPGDLRPLIRDFAAGLFNEDEYWAMFSKITGVVIPDEKNLYTKFFNPTQNLDTLEVISDLKKNGIRVVAGTNVEPPHRIWHEEHNDYQIFDRTYTSDQIRAVKPEVEFFNRIIELENLDSDNFFFTDDRLENVEAAVSAGMIGYQFKGAIPLRTRLKELKLLC